MYCLYSCIPSVKRILLKTVSILENDDRAFDVLHY